MITLIHKILRINIIDAFTVCLSLIVFLYATFIFDLLKNMLREFSILIFIVLLEYLLKFYVSAHNKKIEEVFIEKFDVIIGNFILRKSFSSTFIRLFLWNILIDFLLIFAGFITFGLFPLVWVFLMFGIASPDFPSLKDHAYLWFENACLILSATIGFWGGLRLDQVLENISSFLPPMIGFIILIQGIASFLEVLETIKIKREN